MHYGREGPHFASTVGAQAEISRCRAWGKLNAHTYFGWTLPE